MYIIRTCTQTKWVTYKFTLKKNGFPDMPDILKCFAEKIEIYVPLKVEFFYALPKPLCT